MTAAARRRKREAAGAMLAQADRFERRATRASTVAERQRLRGRAPQSRGSAWVLQADAMETP